ncbi:hypothetical protein MHU86_24580 [Fragilaria crotonensis]|nr:hypothetical protein MHU86_24580 [Fragilaria crotonensis]
MSCSPHFLLFKAFLAFSCSIQTSVSGLTNLADLIVGPRSQEWARTYCPESMQSQHQEEFERTHALFTTIRDTIRRSGSGRSGSGNAAASPFFIKCGDSTTPVVTFGTTQLQAALQSDYLDAGEGSTDERRGWKMKPVARTNLQNEMSSNASTASTTSTNCAFLQSRVSFADLEQAKGTVIFNSAGAYTSSTLAATCLAALDGMNTYHGEGATTTTTTTTTASTAVGVCLNMYVTTSGTAKTSAPPHTDMQDVVVLQTQGRKHWKVYSPPDNQVALVESVCEGEGS